jgi:SAM-dependent methyltransferase
MVRSKKSEADKLRELHTSRKYVIDMYDPEFVEEYDHCVEQDYGKIDHLNIPAWILEQLSTQHTLRVLDLGCGTGLSSRLFFERANCFVTGVDLTPAMCDHARTNKPFDRVICQSIEDELPFEEGVFDACIMLGVLEFVGDPSAVAKEARRCLREGGLFGCSVPLKIDFEAEKEMGVQSYHPEEVHGMIEAAGFEKVRQEHLHGYTLDYEETGQSFTVNYAASMWRAM